MNALERYHEVIAQSLKDLKAQHDKLDLAARWLSETLQQDGLLYVAGSGHSHMLAEEVFYRAGGLAAVYPLLDSSIMLHHRALRSSALERLEGFAKTILDDTELGSKDLLIVASNSGRNAFPIELTLEAKKRGCKTVAISSVTHSQAVSSRHSSGKRLFELADLVINNTAGYGDASLEFSGLSSKLGPVSSLCGMYIMNAVVVRAVELCLEAGFTPDTFISANMQNSQQTIDLNYWKSRIKAL